MISVVSLNTISAANHSDFLAVSQKDHFFKQFCPQLNFNFDLLSAITVEGQGLGLRK